VLPYVPLDRSVRGGKPEVVVAIASAPYWAFAIHTAELLQGYMEGRGLRETGVRSIREVGGSYWSLPDRQQWGGPLFDALLASAKTHYLTRAAPLEVITSQSSVVLIQYVDGTRAVLALIPRTFDDHEYLLGAQFPDGAVSMGGVVLPGAPFDHFGYLVRALVELFTTGRPCVPVERTLLTTGIVLFGQEARQKGTFVSTPTLAISYPSPRPCP